ncbi:hypothetical protein [Deinococcus xinjiangensis]|uniref:hypothetical protein n=1 Tax=Deinococcus xinjiangensis TaxID=457454 RepID=UPI00336589C2
MPRAALRPLDHVTFPSFSSDLVYLVLSTADGGAVLRGFTAGQAFERFTMAGNLFVLQRSEVADLLRDLEV